MQASSLECFVQAERGLAGERGLSAGATATRSLAPARCCRTPLAPSLGRYALIFAKVTQRTTPALITSLRLWDVVAMNIVAIVGLRWISRSARIGAPAVTLWILACLLFFVPLAAVLAELSSKHPEQGGIYAWARRAFGPLHGYICGWCLWVNNLFYFPSLLLFAAANLLIPIGASQLADNRVYSVTFVLGFVWLMTFVNILGF